MTLKIIENDQSIQICKMFIKMKSNKIENRTKNKFHFMMKKLFFESRLLILYLIKFVTSTPKNFTLLARLRSWPLYHDLSLSPL